MKNLIILSAFLLSSVFSFNACAQANSETISFEVAGNCGMCKKRIERSLADAKGVKSASWDKSTKMLTVVCAPGKTNEKTLQQIVAGVGHDTPLVKANDKVYSKLPDCCLYRDGNPHDHDH